MCWVDSMGMANGHPIYGYSGFLKIGVLVFLKLQTGGRVMRVYDASTRISAEFGGIRDLSRHLSLNFLRPPTSPSSHTMWTSYVPLSVSLLFCSVLSVLRFRQFALQFRCQFGASPPAPIPKLVRSLVCSSSVPSPAPILCRWKPERSERGGRRAPKGRRREADPAEVAPPLSS